MANQIEIALYRPEWSNEFVAVAGEIRDSLGPVALHVHHIGSTSVPGLAAENVIDVQVSVDDLL